MPGSGSIQNATQSPFRQQAKRVRTDETRLLSRSEQPRSLVALSQISVNSGRSIVEEAMARRQATLDSYRYHKALLKQCPNQSVRRRALQAKLEILKKDLLQTRSIVQIKLLQEQEEKQALIKEVQCLRDEHEQNQKSLKEKDVQISRLQQQLAIERRGQKRTSKNLDANQ